MHLEEQVVVREGQQSVDIHSAHPAVAPFATPRSFSSTKAFRPRLSERVAARRRNCSIASGHLARTHPSGEGDANMWPPRSPAAVAPTHLGGERVRGVPAPKRTQHEEPPAGGGRARQATLSLPAPSMRCAAKRRLWDHAAGDEERGMRSPRRCADGHLLFPRKHPVEPLVGIGAAPCGHPTRTTPITRYAHACDVSSRRARTRGVVSTYEGSLRLVRRRARERDRHVPDDVLVAGARRSARQVAHGAVSGQASSADPPG